MPIADPAVAAKALYEARRTRVPIAPFTDAHPDMGMADGYAVQQHLVRMLLEEGEKIVGVDSPDYGPVFASTLYPSGADVPMTRFIQPKIEAEIAYVLGETLAGP